jgi:hypothetical protein
MEEKRNVFGNRNEGVSEARQLHGSPQRPHAHEAERGERPQEGHPPLDAAELDLARKSHRSRDPRSDDPPPRNTADDDHDTGKEKPLL